MHQQRREADNPTPPALYREVGVWTPNIQSEDLRFDYYFLKLFGGAVINTPMALNDGAWSTVTKCQRDRLTINDGMVEYIWAVEERDLPLFANREHYRAKIAK